MAPQMNNLLTPSGPTPTASLQSDLLSSPPSNLSQQPSAGLMPAPLLGQTPVNHPFAQPMPGTPGSMNSQSSMSVGSVGASGMSAGGMLAGHPQQLQPAMGSSQSMVGFYVFIDIKLSRARIILAYLLYT